MSFHPEAISSEQLSVLRTLAPAVTERGFYLGGGTAVALHLGPRRSEDFAWFKESSFGDPLLLARSLREVGSDFETTSVAAGTLHGRIGGVRVSFLEYGYPPLESPLEWSAAGCRVASLDDLACMKLAAVAQRGSRKDFVDIYALLRNHRPLPGLLERYRRRYDVKDVGHVVTALAYFDEAEPEPMPVMLWDVDWPTVRETVLDSVEAYAGDL